MTIIGALVIGALALSACRPAAGRESVVIGVGSSVEQQVLGAIAAEALRRADMAVQLEEVEGQTVALRRRAGAGAVDLFWDYTGAAFALGLGEQVAPAADPSESYERIRTADERSGLHWLAPTSANATLALFVRSEDLPPADADRSLTWLAGALSSGEATLCADPDFLASPAGLSSLAVEYAINLDQVEQRPAGEEEAVEAVAAGECFAGLATATSPAAARAGLVPVADVRSVFPAFVVAPVTRVADPVLRARIERALAPVTAALDTATLARLNAEVAAGANAEEVARSFVDAALAAAATEAGSGG